MVEARDVPFRCIAHGNYVIDKSQGQRNISVKKKIRQRCMRFGMNKRDHIVDCNDSVAPAQLPRCEEWSYPSWIMQEIEFMSPCRQCQLSRSECH